MSLELQLAASELGLMTAADFVPESTMSFLPRLQLMTSAAELVKKGDFPVNRYALVIGQDYNDLGKQVDVLVITYHSKALDMNQDPPAAAYNRDGELYKRIADQSKTANSKCMYGPEFLVYVPSRKVFATFFMGSVTARNEATEVAKRMQKAGTLTSKGIEHKKHGTYYAATMIDCNTPFDIPSNADIAAAVKQFKDSERETVNAEPAEEDTRAR